MKKGLKKVEEMFNLESIQLSFWKENETKAVGKIPVEILKIEKWKGGTQIPQIVHDLFVCF